MELRKTHGAVTKESIGMFSENNQAFQRLGKDCIDLAFDYVHHRHCDLNFTDMEKAYEGMGFMHMDMRTICATIVQQQGKKIEFKRKNYALFPQFKKTFCWKKEKMSFDELVTAFKDDLLRVVFKCDDACVTWPNIIMAIVLTSMFVRHAADGNRSPQCIQAFFNGLGNAIDQLGSAVCKLKGWPCFIKYYKEKDKNLPSADELFSGVMPGSGEARSQSLVSSRRSRTPFRSRNYSCGSLSSSSECSPPARYPSRRSRTPIRSHFMSRSPSCGSRFYQSSSSSECLPFQREPSSRGLRSTTRTRAPTFRPSCTPARHRYTSHSPILLTASLESLGSPFCRASQPSSTLPECQIDTCKCKTVKRRLRHRSSHLSFAAEAQALALDMVMFASGINIMGINSILPYQAVQMKSRRDIMRRAIHKRAMTVDVTEADRALQCAYLRYTDKEQFACDVEVAMGKLLDNVDSCGWDAVIAVFLAIRNLICDISLGCKEMDKIKAISRGTYCAFLKREEKIQTKLGGWADFERLHRRFLR